MVEQYRRRKGKQKILGNHQRCWIWGRHAVVETLRAGKWPILELYLGDRLLPQQLEAAIKWAHNCGLSPKLESFDGLSHRCRSAEHQGYVAKMAPYAYDDAEELLKHCQPQAFYAILDSIQDPHNFGSVIRSAAAMDVDALFVAETGQVEVTSQVARSSAGAVNHVAIAKVANLTALVTELKSLGIAVVASSADAKMPIFDYDFRKPTALVIGNEGAGIRDGLFQLCDTTIRIPLNARAGALNAAVSAGILFYEASRQRQTYPNNRP